MHRTNEPTNSHSLALTATPSRRPAVRPALWVIILFLLLGCAPARAGRGCGTVTLTTDGLLADFSALGGAVSPAPQPIPPPGGELKVTVSNVVICDTSDVTDPVQITFTL